MKMASHSSYTSAFKEAKASAVFVAEGLMLDVATTVWAVMKRLGLSQRELASKLGKHPAYVSRILNGSHNLTLKTIAEVAVALGQQVRIEIEPQASAEDSAPAAAGFLAIVPTARRGTAFEILNTFDNPTQPEAANATVYRRSA
jgi:transcriptional regulator with XRE-family HTH domain